MALDHYLTYTLHHTNMEILTWIILGTVAGGIVAYASQEKNRVYIYCLLGVLGAMVAGGISNIFSLKYIAGIYDETVVIIVIGAGTVIWLGRKLLVKS